MDILEWVEEQTKDWTVIDYGMLLFVSMIIGFVLAYVAAFFILHI